MKKKLTALAAAAMIAFAAPAPASAYELPQPFLTGDVAVSAGTTYKPYRVSEDMAKTIREKGKEMGENWNVKVGDPLQAGLLLSKRTDIAVAGQVVNATIQNDGTSSFQAMNSLFEKGKLGGVSFEGQMTAHTVNLILKQSEKLINSAAKAGVEKYNEKNKTNIPTDIVTVKVLDIEEMAQENGVWKLGARVIADADGFVLPLYLRTALYKHGDDLRSLTLLCDDAGKDILKGAFESLLEKTR